MSSVQENIQEIPLQVADAAADPVAAVVAAVRPARRRQPNWTSQEKELLLDFIEEVLPQGINEWQEVERLFLETWTLRTGQVSQRDMVSMRSLFKRMHTISVPTGDPHCPPAVRRAKRIYHEILSFAGGVGGRNVRQRVIADPAFRNDADEDGIQHDDEEEMGEDEADAAAGNYSIQRGRRNHSAMNDFERRMLDTMQRREEGMRQMTERMIAQLRPSTPPAPQMFNVLERIMEQMESITEAFQMLGQRIDRIERASMGEDGPPPLIRRGDSASEYDDSEEDEA